MANFHGRRGIRNSCGDSQTDYYKILSAESVSQRRVADEEGRTVLVLEPVAPADQEGGPAAAAAGRGHKVCHWSEAAFETMYY